MTNSLKTDSATQFSRRQFIKTGIAAGAGFTIIPNHVLAAHGRPGANDKINHAIIGVGSMGNGHVRKVVFVNACRNMWLMTTGRIKQYVKDAQARLVGHIVLQDTAPNLISALTIVRWLLYGKKQSSWLLPAAGVRKADIEEHVARTAEVKPWPFLDAVSARNAREAVVQFRLLGEGQAIVDAARRNGRMFRLNTWFRLYGQFYQFGTPVEPIARLVRSGLLGWPLTVRVSPHTGFPWHMSGNIGRIGQPAEPIPEDLDYDIHTRRIAHPVHSEPIGTMTAAVWRTSGSTISIPSNTCSERTARAPWKSRRTRRGRSIRTPSAAGGRSS